MCAPDDRREKEGGGEGALLLACTRACNRGEEVAYVRAREGGGRGVCVGGVVPQNASVWAVGFACARRSLPPPTAHGDHGFRSHGAGGGPVGGWRQGETGDRRALLGDGDMVKRAHQTMVTHARMHMCRVWCAVLATYAPSTCACVRALPLRPQRNPANACRARASSPSRCRPGGSEESPPCSGDPGGCRYSVDLDKVG